MMNEWQLISVVLVIICAMLWIEIEMRRAK